MFYDLKEEQDNGKERKKGRKEGIRNVKKERKKWKGNKRRKDK